MLLDLNLVEHIVTFFIKLTVFRIIAVRIGGNLQNLVVIHRIMSAAAIVQCYTVSKINK